MDTRRRTGSLLLGLGALLLIGQFAGGLSWPLFVLLPGLAILAVALVGPRSAAPRAVPVSIVTTVGLILFVQDLTGRFETWSYAWGLVQAAAGAGMFLYASLEDRPPMQREGLRVMTIGLALFAAFGVFFEFLVFDGSLRGAGGWILPLLLILAGAWMLRERARA